MSEQQSSSSNDSRPAGDAAGAQGGGRRHPRRRFWLFAGVAGAIATMAACSHGGPGGPGGWGGMGGGGWGHHGRGPMTPEQIAQRVDRGVDRILGDVGATDDQKKKVSGIVKQALTELAPVREQHRAARRKAAELLAAPTIDRAALEKLRAEQLQLGDTASRRITQALADTAEVLTPEQRAKLKDKLDRRMNRS